MRVPFYIKNYLSSLLSALVLLVAISGCGVFGDDDELNLDGDVASSEPKLPVEQLYNEAKDELDSGSVKKAIEKFEEVERQYPYSEWAVRAQIMSAYASYRNEDYDAAIATLHHFVKLHPGNENTPYAFYLLALCYYEQISDVGRDQKMTQEAQRALEEVIKRYPDSEYARDAKLKLDLVADHLAGKEMEIGRYYLKRNEYLSAINRFKYVIDHYQTTSHTPEALHRLVESYLKLGVRDEAKKYTAVLGYNYPGSRWYRESYRLLTGEGLTAEPEKGGFWSKWLP